MLSIIIATIVSMVIGGAWFGPKTFYPVMMEELEQSDERVLERMERFNPSFHFGIVILAEFTLATIIYGLLEIANGDLRVIIFPAFFVVVSNIKTNIFSDSLPFPSPAMPNLTDLHFPSPSSLFTLLYYIFIVFLLPLPFPCHA